MKREEVKYVRDGIKARYPSGAMCQISGETSNIQMHHYYSVSELWAKWKRKNKIKITCLEDVLEHRERFYEEHTKELLEDVAFLTKEWHDRLHTYFGQHPSLGTAKAQKNWVRKCSEKHKG